MMIVARYDVVHIERSRDGPMVREGEIATASPNQMTVRRVQYFLKRTSVCLMCFIRCKSFSVILVSFWISIFLRFYFVFSSFSLLCPSSSLTSHTEALSSFQSPPATRHPDFSVHDYRPTTRNTYNY